MKTLRQGLKVIQLYDANMREHIASDGIVYFDNRLSNDNALDMVRDKLVKQHNAWANDKRYVKMNARYMQIIKHDSNMRVIELSPVITLFSGMIQP